MKPELWIAQAERSLETAQLVLGTDPNAACSRAYYAMFYAARAALLRAGHAEQAMGKTHSGLI
ncbi:MAG TPA: HEPN domain-containing protein, partial [Sphingomonas sp.]|nr:HEPN domain-containing protein [Sphingomonas sp.]